MLSLVPLEPNVGKERPLSLCMTLEGVSNAGACSGYEKSTGIRCRERFGIYKLRLSQEDLLLPVVLTSRNEMPARCGGKERAAGARLEAC